MTHGKCNQCPGCKRLYSWHEHPGFCPMCLLHEGEALRLIEVEHEAVKKGLDKTGKGA